MSASTFSVKYLGVLLDPKLNYNQHPSERRRKLYPSVWVCRRAMVKFGGICPKVVTLGSFWNTVCVVGLVASSG